MQGKKLGTGILFKMAHFDALQQNAIPIDWLELITDHFLTPSVRGSFVLDALKERYPLALHGVGLGIGSGLPLDFDYIKKIKELADLVDAPWVSEHISWGQVPGAHFHELLPMPYTSESAAYVIERAATIQDFLERPFALENISSYVQDENKEMEEWEFCSTIVTESNTHMILDVNNVYVTAHNLGFDPDEYLEKMPWEQVIEIHLSGHTDRGDCILDSHEGSIHSAVWQLYEKAWVLAGEPATLIEYGEQPLEEIGEEVSRAQELQSALSRRGAHVCT